MDKRIDQLTNAYTEFIDIAAHDLDAPLRKLSVLVERLLSQENKAEQQPYATRIQHCVADMRSIIDGLSTLSKVIAEPLKLKACDLNGMIKSLHEELRSQYEDRQITISSEDLPSIEGDEGQLCRLLKNLLENAIVYNVNREAKIRITHVMTGNDLKILIDDNGIGLKPENTEKIFQAFVRLHGKSEYPGKGLGLAISKKIAENHQGTLTAASADEGGARFILHLPRKQN
jgi:light-regulated signal transduction histidine kinase (bacteriophytochrome)